VTRSYESGWIAWFARNPVAANLLMVFILAAGATSLAQMRVEGFPTLPPNSISIDIPNQSSTAQDADEAIAQKVESALNGTEGIKQVVSKSTRDHVELTVNMTEGFDINRLLSEIKTRVDGIDDFPPNAEKPVIRKEEEREYVITIHVTGSADFADLLSTAERLHKQLLADPEVRYVHLNGERSSEVEVTISEAKLSAMDMTLADVAEQVNSFSSSSGRSELFDENGTLAINGSSQGRYISDFLTIPLLSQPDGAIVRLGDVAQVTERYVRGDVLSTFNGKPTVTLELESDNRTHILRVAEAAREIVEQFRSQSKPVAVDIVPWYDSSDYVRSRLGLMVENGVIGMFLVFLILALLLNFKVAFWVAIGLPVAIAGALLLMGGVGFGMTLNELTTFGFIIAFGIVVDDAVVVGESIYSSGRGNTIDVDSAISGAKRVATPVIFGVLTTIVAFFALTLIEGEMGKLFSQFAFVVAFCLIFSLVESLWVLPAHLVDTKPPPLKTRKLNAIRLQLLGAASRRLEIFIRKGFGPALVRLIYYRYGVVAIALAVGVASFGLVSSGKVRTVFFPEIPGDIASASLWLYADAGYGLRDLAAQEIESAAHKANAALREEHDLEESLIKSIYTNGGNATSASIEVELSAREQRPISSDEFARKWEEMTPLMEGVETTEYITSWERSPDIEILLQARGLEELESANAVLLDKLNSLSAVDNIATTLGASQPQLKLSVNALGNALGLSGEDLTTHAQYVADGYELQRFQREGKSIRVVLRRPGDRIEHAAAIADSRIQTPNGGAVPLELIADLKSGYVVDTITRVGSSPTASTSIDVDKQVTSPDDFLGLLEDSIIPSILADYPEVQVFFDGEVEDQKSTGRSLIWIAILVLTAIYILLAIPLKSYVQPMLILAIVPFSLTGAIIGHWISDVSISLLSIFGVLALNGIIVNDSLLLISRFNTLVDKGMDIYDAVRSAACHRMRAILLTSITTFVALSPLMTEQEEQAQVLVPAAVAIGYGVVFASVVTLVVLPALIVILRDLINWSSRDYDHGVDKVIPRSH